MTRDRLQYIKSYIDSGPDIKGTVMYFILDEVVTALEAAWEERDDAIKERGFLSSQNSELIEDIAAITLERNELRETVKVLSERTAEVTAELDKDILHGGEVKDGWRDVAQERLSQCSRLNLLLNKSERECCDLKLVLHKVECERDELKETVKVLSERLADMAVERDRGSLSLASECIDTQEMAELKKYCLRALSCLYISVEEPIANDVKAKVVAYISALEDALAEAVTDRDEFEGRLNDIYSVMNLGVASPRT